MIDKDKITQTVFQAIDEINQQLPAERRLDKSTDTVLFGETGTLDSLGLVNLIVMTEEYVADEFDIIVNIADQRAMSQKNSPFRTVDTLADYIGVLLQENQNGSGAV